MRERKSKIRGCIYLFTIFLTVSIVLSPFRSFAGDMEILLDDLVNKGVLTKQDAENILKKMQETKSKEPEKAKAEGKAPEPEWVKNVPDWIKNPPDWIKNIKFSGDLRLRYEYLDREPAHLQNGTSVDIPDENRFRFRYRLGIDTKVFDNVTVGFGLASGSANPRSNNLTFGNEFTNKGVVINYAYAAYSPLSWVTISGGKFKSNPIYRCNSLGFFPSELIWDNDLTPEGVAVIFNYPSLLKLEAVSVDVFMNNVFLYVDEFATGQPNPYMFAVQPGFNLKIMKDINLKVAGGYYQFFGIKNKPELGNQPSSPGGLPAGAIYGVGDSNSRTVTTPAGGNYLYNYNSFTASGELGYKTPFQDIVPYVGLFGEFITNLSAHHNDDGWTAGIRIGHPFLTKLWDWQLMGAYERLERDAWLDVFPNDDFYQGMSNAKGYKLSAALGITKNISVGVNYFHTVNILPVSTVFPTLFTAGQNKQPERSCAR